MSEPVEPLPTHLPFGAARNAPIELTTLTAANTSTGSSSQRHNAAFDIPSVIIPSAVATIHIGTVATGEARNEDEEEMRAPFGTATAVIPMPSEFDSGGKDRINAGYVPDGSTDAELATQTESAPLQRRSLSRILRAHEVAVTKDLGAAITSETEAARLQQHVDHLRTAADASATAHAAWVRPFDMDSAWAHPVFDWLPATNGDAPPPPRITASIADGVAIHIGNLHIRVYAVSLCIRILVLGVAWLALWTIFPATFLYPGGYIFDPLACWLMATVFGTLSARLAGVPPLLGILIFGVVWGNIPKFGQLTKGIVPEFRTFCSRTMLAVVMIRAGLLLNTDQLVSNAKMIVPMALLPLAVEIVVHGAVASALFDDYTNNLWPYFQGAIAAPSSPATLVPGLVILRANGYGEKRGLITSFAIASAIDITMGSWCVNFLNDLLFRDPHSSIGVLIGAIPAQFAVGIAGGIIAGLLWDFVFFDLMMREARQLPGGGYWSRHVSGVSGLAWFALVLLSVFSMFFGYRVKYPGGGIVGSFVVGLTVNVLMTRRSRIATAAAAAAAAATGESVPIPKQADMGSTEYSNPLSRLLSDIPPAPAAVKTMPVLITRHMNDFWDILVIPWGFSMIGAAITLPQIFSGPFFWRSLICLLAGFFARVAVAILTTLPNEMLWKERVIAGIIFASRAAAQTGFGQLAVTALKSGSVVSFGGGADVNTPALQVLFAQRVANVGAMSVLLFAPFTQIMLAKVAPKMFLKDTEWEELKRKEMEIAAAKQQ